MSTSHDYGPEVLRIDSRTRSLETTLSGLESELSSLRSKLGQVDDLDDELRDIRDDIDRTRSDLSELDDDVRSHIDDNDHALKRLTARVQALEAQLHAADGAPRADLDTIDPEWTKLAQTADRGRQVRSSLLTADQRAAHHSTIRQYNAAIEERDEHRNKVVEAAKILAGTPHTSPEFKQAASDFGTSRGLAERHHERARTLTGPAQKAHAALTQDDELRSAKASLIEQGSKAEKKLDWLLRGRLADAIRDRALLPMWFVTVLGPVPPADRTQEWMDLATQVLVYRVTYRPGVGWCCYQRRRALVSSRCHGVRRGT
ncbi:hypothetical protein ADL27_48545 [Streptomyces sp. NRRL F-6602]|nr:hypothetical protein ADL27_48545 [Streptomyces sp. NRRL F-6602]